MPPFLKRCNLNALISLFLNSASVIKKIIFLIKNNSLIYNNEKTVF